MPPLKTTKRRAQLNDTLLDLDGDPAVQLFIEAATDLLEPAPEAVACTALGCRIDSDLFRVRIDNVGQRVLCSTHVIGWVRKEVLEDV